MTMQYGLPLPAGANPADYPQAARFHWNDVLCAGDPTLCGSNRYSFQAILIDRGGGDFDLELNYGDIPAGIGTARFTLGPNLYSAGGPFSPTVDYDFSFRGGVLVDGGGGTVDEPSAAWLLLIATIGWMATRRRSA